VLSVTLAMISCNNGMNKNPVATKREDSAKPVGNQIMIPVTLSYQFNEKDKNKGTVEGKLTGDTLLANYTFMSEGVQSIRQVIFLVRDNVVSEGYGAQQLTDGKMVFINLKEISFGESMPLKKVSYDNAAAQRAAVKSGNAHLLFYPGKLSTVSGNAGCNNLKGSFELKEGGEIKFSPIATTRKACGENTREA
jgi:hypothetical protein